MSKRENVATENIMLCGKIEHDMIISLSIILIN